MVAFRACVLLYQLVEPSRLHLILWPGVSDTVEKPNFENPSLWYGMCGLASIGALNNNQTKPMTNVAWEFVAKCTTLFCISIVALLRSACALFCGQWINHTVCT